MRFQKKRYIVFKKFDFWRKCQNIGLLKWLLKWYLILLNFRKTDPQLSFKIRFVFLSILFVILRLHEVDCIYIYCIYMQLYEKNMQSSFQLKCSSWSMKLPLQLFSYNQITRGSFFTTINTSLKLFIYFFKKAMGANYFGLWGIRCRTKSYPYQQRHLCFWLEHLRLLGRSV